MWNMMCGALFVACNKKYTTTHVHNCMLRMNMFIKQVSALMMLSQSQMLPFRTVTREQDRNSLFASPSPMSFSLYVN